MVSTKKKTVNRVFNRSINKPKSKKKKYKRKVKKFIVEKKMSDESIAKREGDYFDSKSYDIILRSDADVFYIKDGKEVPLIKFRKAVFPNNLCHIGLNNLREAAKKFHDNRGAAAGKVMISKLPTYANDPKKWKSKSTFRVTGYYSKESGKFVNNSIGNLSQSNIIGYFDRADRNLGKDAPKCRTTAFTSQQVSKWKAVLPFIKCIDAQFKELLPDRHKIQLNRARKTKRWQILNTAFSTLTINHNWRTALHKDKGDLNEGFGNLIVLEEGNYKGGETGFPQFGVAVDVRHGDFLGMDVHEWHCNTKIIGKNYTRLSLVAYLRESMIECANMNI